MADSPTIDNGALADVVVSTEEATTLNGSTVTAQQVQRVLLAIRTADATVRDLPGGAGQIIDETGTLRTVNRAFVNATASGNTPVVTAQGGGVRIRVLSVNVITLTALTVKFQSATTDISPAAPLGANGGYVLPRNVDGWFQTSANEALNINLSGAGTVSCLITWVQAT